MKVYSTDQRTRRHSRYSGQAPWYVPDDAVFDLIETNGYNAHARVLLGTDPWAKLPEFVTTLEDVGVPEHAHLRFDEMEGEWESFFGVVPTRPTIKHVYLGWEPDPWVGWDAEDMFRELEGREPKFKPEPQPAVDVPVRRCSKCHQIGHNIKTCDTPWHRRPRTAGPSTRKRKPKAKTKKKARGGYRCSVCNRQGHNKLTCPRLLNQRKEQR